MFFQNPEANMDRISAATAEYPAKVETLVIGADAVGLIAALAASEAG